MSMGRFILSVVVVFVLFGAGHSIWPMFFTDVTASVEAAMLPAEQQDFGLMMFARLAQTVVIVWIYFNWIASNDIKVAATYGAGIGVLLAGSDAAYYSMTVLPNSAIPVLAIMEIIVAAIACAALAKLYEPAE